MQGDIDFPELFRDTKNIWFWFSRTIIFTRYTRVMFWMSKVNNICWTICPSFSTAISTNSTKVVTFSSFISTTGPTIYIWITSTAFFWRNCGKIRIGMKNLQWIMKTKKKSRVKETRSTWNILRKWKLILNWIRLKNILGILVQFWANFFIISILFLPGSSGGVKSK